VRIWLAEFIGTFALVFAGVGAIAAGMDALGVALAFGSVVAVMITAVGAISYAHFNPAVTVGFFMLRRITYPQVLLYWSAELVGATAAMLLLRFWYGTERLEAVAYGATQLAPDLSPLAGIGIEAVLTFFLMFVIASCVIQKQAFAGVYVGLTVTLGAIAGGSLTGASMNPARSFAPALVGNIWTHQWLYWLAIIIGAALAAVTASYLWRPNRVVEEATSPALQQMGD
jgi:MIP family channel proteins